jgi:Tol biopolymer transport system component/DNA-binding winged helix-turn-helix (wHTH) protein
MAGELKFGASRRFLFGPFEYDETSGSLHKHGIRVRLQGQPLQILSVLLRRSGQVISRDDFQRELWQGSTFVDFEHGLNAAVNRLRQTLGDSAEQPRYIETLPGKGYRFMAPLNEMSPKPILAIATSSADKLVKVRSRAWIKPGLGSIIVAAALVTAALGGYLAGHRNRPPMSAPPLRFKVQPPAGYVLQSASSRQSFALSPDGTRLAFTALDASGAFRVFLRQFNRLDSEPLADSVGSYTLFWASDGRSLYFTARGTLRRSTLQGDSQQVICDAPAIMFSGASFAPDRLLLSGRTANFVVSASGGTPRRIKELYSWPQTLSDGKHVLYSTFDSQIGRHRVRVARLGEPDTAKDLLETDSRAVYTDSIAKPGGYIVSVRGGNLLAYPFHLGSLRITGEPIPLISKIYTFHPTGAADFSVSNNGVLAYQRYVSRSQLAWTDRRGQIVSTIGPGGINLKLARLSPDGKKIATSIYEVEHGVNHIWIIDAETGTARRVIPGPGLVDSPVWSPDSTRIAFSRAFDSPPKLFVRGIGERDAEEALPPAYFQAPADWSPDGRFIAFTNSGFAQIENELQGDVWMVDMARQRKVVPLLNTPFHEANPAFSPDGHWLAFTSSESGRIEVYLQAFRGGDSPGVVGERLLVSRNGAEYLRWGRDGKELFYLGSDGRLYAVPITLSVKPKIGAPAPLFAISTEAMAALHSSIGFDISADGQRFLVPIVTSSEKSEIVVIQNWEEALKANAGKLN